MWIWNTTHLLIYSKLSVHWTSSKRKRTNVLSKSKNKTKRWVFYFIKNISKKMNKVCSYSEKIIQTCLISCWQKHILSFYSLCTGHTWFNRGPNKTHYYVTETLSFIFYVKVVQKHLARFSHIGFFNININDQTVILCVSATASSWSRDRVLQWHGHEFLHGKLFVLSKKNG